MEATPVYQRTLEAMQEYSIVCSEGGSRSSKTWSTFQYFILKAMSGERFSVTIVRKKMTWLRDTLLDDFGDILSKYPNIKITPAINRDRANQTYFIKNATFTFWGLDDPQKAHGKKQDYFWINEAMEVDKNEFNQIEMRTTRGGILDYNPSDDNHWIFSLHKRPDVGVIKSTQLDNPFLSPRIRKTILSYKPTPENIAQGTADNYMWQVYGLGNKAKLQGLIYENWEPVDAIPEDAKLIAYCLDYGYTNDPTSVNEIYMFNNAVYANELIYETGMTNPMICERLEQLKIKKDLPIYAESSEPKSNAEIEQQGYYIVPVVKGEDSVRFGINILKGYKVYYTRRSVDIDTEVRKYKWAEDKNGNSLNVPVDKFNHAMDAIRYFAMMALSSQTAEPDVRWF